MLFLDTCEHVLNAAAHICDVVLAQTPDIRVLATSRQVLRARGEKVVWLAPLEVPPQDYAGTARDVLRYSAPQLLAARAFEKTGYRVEDGDARAIAEICRRLDGAPLAIELVSSRLAGRSADMRPSGNSMIDFRTLRGGTLLAVHCGSGHCSSRSNGATRSSPGTRPRSCARSRSLQLPSTRTLRFALSRIFLLLRALRSTPSPGLRAKSMLSVDQTFGELRYRLLDTTRAFACNLLESQGELEAVSASHARLQLEILTRAGAEHATMTARRCARPMAARPMICARRSIGRFTVLAICCSEFNWPPPDCPCGMNCPWGTRPRRNCERALAEFEHVAGANAALKLKLVLGLATVGTYLADDAARTVALFETAIQLAR